jgi:sec-independent protein translocase protein TatB
MFNVGGGEIIVILLIALIVLGPDKLPDAAKKVGKVMGDLRRLSDGFKQEMQQVTDFRDDDAAPGTPNGPYLVGPPASADGTATAPATGGDPASPPPVSPATDAPPPGPTGDVDGPPTEQAGGSSAA